jgi:hypothetical protein
MRERKREKIEMNRENENERDILTRYEFLFMCEAISEISK